MLLHTGLSDCVLVNSNFTAETFFKTFPTLKCANPRVLYPSLNFSAYDKEIRDNEKIQGVPLAANIVFLSINRFERKKNLQLALKALANLKDIVSQTEWKSIHLVIAGIKFILFGFSFVRILMFVIQAYSFIHV